MPCEYPSGLAQGPPAGVNARPTMQGKRVAEPGKAGGVPPPLCVGADDFIGPPSGLADGWRWRAGTCLWPQCRAGDFARRGALRHRKVSGTMRASAPTEAGQGPAGPCRIFLPLTGNAPLRLRLAAHPPPLAGEALGGLPPIKPPLQGEVSPQATEGCGTLPCQYPSGVAQTSPAGVNARPTMQGIRAARLGTAARRTPPGHRRLRRGRCLHRPAGGLDGWLAFVRCCPLAAAM